MPALKYWDGTQWLSTPLAPAGPPGGTVFQWPIGDGVATSFTVPHGLGTRNVGVYVYRSAAPYDEIEVDVERTDTSNVTVRTFPTVPAVGEYTVAVAAGGTPSLLSITMDTWHSVGAAGEPAFQNTWANYGSGFRTAGFRKTPDGRVWIRGFISGGTIGQPAFTLPAGYRPTQTEIHDVQTGGGIAQCYVNTDGTVNVSTGTNTWVTLNHISFDTDSVTSVATINAFALDTWHVVGNPGEPVYTGGFVAFDATRYVRFRKFPDGRVRLAGTAKSGSSGSGVFTLPVGYRPPNDQLFPIVASGGTAYCTVSATGPVIVFNFTGNVNLQAELNGIEFDTETVNAYSTGVFPYLPVSIDQWHNVGTAGEPVFANNGNYSAANSDTVGFRKFPDGKVRLKGIYANGTISGALNVFVLPVGYRPPTIQRFAIAGNNAPFYLQVLNDGTVQLVNVAGYGTAAGWVDFTSVEFDTQAVTQVASSAAVPIDGWHIIGNPGEPAFTNGWGNTPGYPAAFRKDAFGRVWLRGMITGGTLGTTAFTLPAGFAPDPNFSNPEFVSIANATVAARTIVVNNGAVVPYVSNTNHSLQNVSFDTGTVSTYATATVQQAVPPKVTSLPVAPVDGQECYYVADAANSILWHLRYNAGWATNAYKWEVVGGAPLAIRDDTNLTLANAAWTNGGSIVTPLAGVYDLEADYNGYCTGVANSSIQMQATGTGTGTLYSLAAYGAAGNSVNAAGSCRRTTIATAGNTIQMQYYAPSTGGVGRFRNLSVMPVRVG